MHKETSLKKTQIKSSYGIHHQGYDCNCGAYDLYVNLDEPRNHSSRSWRRARKLLVWPQTIRLHSDSWSWWCWCGPANDAALITLLSTSGSPCWSDEQEGCWNTWLMYVVPESSRLRCYDHHSTARDPFSCGSLCAKHHPLTVSAVHTRLYYNGSEGQRTFHSTDDPWTPTAVFGIKQWRRLWYRLLGRASSAETLRRIPAYLQTQGRLTILHLSDELLIAIIQSAQDQCRTDQIVQIVRARQSLYVSLQWLNHQLTTYMAWPGSKDFTYQIKSFLLPTIL